MLSDPPPANQPLSEPSPPVQPVSRPPLSNPLGNSGKKKYLIIGGGVILLLVIIVFVLGLLQQPTPPQERVSENAESAVTPGTDSSAALPTAVVAPTVPVVLISPESTARGFYTWYVNHPSPLASGAYKTRPDITDKYKSILARYGSRGIDPNRDPVFKCGDGKPPKNVIYKPAEHHGSTTQALVTIAQNVANGRDLYLIKLEKTGELWYVRDVWCAPNT